MHVLHGDTHFVHSIYVDDLRDAWFRRGGKNVLFLSECPDTQISDLFITSQAPVFVFVDDPVDAVGYVMASRGFDIFNAVRFTSQCLCTLNNILKEPSVTRIDRDHYSSDVRDIVRRFLDVIAGQGDDELLDQVMRYLIPGYRAGQKQPVEQNILANFRDARPPGSFVPCLSGKLRDLVNNAIRQYEPISLGLPLGELVWPRELFLHSEDASKFFSRPIELAGPARPLIWGPYMHLPQGKWDVMIEIEVDGNHSGNHLQVDLFSGATVLSSHHAELPIRGVFSFITQAAVLEPQQALALRFFLLSGAIEGVFALRSVRLRPVLSAVSRERPCQNSMSATLRGIHPSNA
jgi:hypothetical protein